MAIGYKSQGAGVSTETSGAALSPLCPATVDAGDVLIAHVFWEGTTTAPSTPSGWDLLNPGGTAFVIEATVARHWVFGRIADGTEDAAAVAFGSPAVTTQRGARIYSFSGRVAGTILQLVGGVTHLSHATDPAMPTVTTPKAGARAVALMAQNDNNTSGNATGESGGDWTEAVAEYVPALNAPGMQMQIQTCIPTADPGTVSGGTVATTNDPCGVIAFWIRDNLQPVSADAGSSSYAITGAAASEGIGSAAGAGAVAVTGAAASEGIGSAAGAGAVAVTGIDATSVHQPATVHTDSNAEPGAYSVSGVDAEAAKGYPSNAEPGSYAVSGADAAAALVASSNAEPGSYAVSGANAAAVVAMQGNAEPGTYSVSGVDAAANLGRAAHAEPGSYAVTGADAGAAKGYPSNAEPGAYAVTGADAGVSRTTNSNAEPGSYAVSGEDADSDILVFGEDPEVESHGSSAAPRMRRKLVRGVMAGLPVPRNTPQTPPVPVKAAPAAPVTHAGAGVVALARVRARATGGAARAVGGTVAPKLGAPTARAAVTVARRARALQAALGMDDIPDFR